VKLKTLLTADLSNQQTILQQQVGLTSSQIQHGPSCKDCL